MAEADGSIIIDTEIDTDGAKVGSRELENHLRKAAAKVNDLGETTKTALNKQIDSFAKLNRETAAQKEKVDELRKDRKSVV